MSILCRVIRPMLLLPQHLLDESNRGEFDAVLARELVHVRSHDLSWNSVIHAIESVRGCREGDVLLRGGDLPLSTALRRSVFVG